ncbi:MAG TPA: transketolase [Candidatus Dormibacteraeota bacterium]|nr:transketolase [Candidatus Dormibacteraeota bacterium]
MDRIAALESRAARLRAHVVGIAAAQYCHLGGSLSCADLMAALFFDALQLEDTAARRRDRFLLSKGHAVHVFHACLAERGLIDAAELPRSGQIGSRLGGHPTTRAPGVEFATGSLGHALSVGLGIALAEQLDGSPSRTVVLLGDGELQEGTVWEAALCAPRFRVPNLLAIVDYNRFQSAGAVDDVLPLEPLADKWRAFRWRVREIDGHDLAAICAALDAPAAADAPTVLIAHTVKGKGVPGVEGTTRAHYTQLTAEEAARTYAALGATP